MADYRGVYVVMEKIKRDSERVDVEKLNELVTDPALITGGYIFKKDKSPWSQPWTTATEGIPLDTHDPETLNNAQFNYLTGLRGHLRTRPSRQQFRQSDTRATRPTSTSPRSSTTT